jgi:hypothetical protein
LGNYHSIPERDNYLLDHLLNFYKIKGDNIVFYGKPGKMDKTDQVVPNELGFSTNITNSSLKNKEKLVAQMLETKFHTKYNEETETNKEFRLNPIMKDLIINRYADKHHMQVVKRKRSKRQNMHVKAKMVESVG